MKKCTLILMVVLTIVACKKEKEDSQEANSSSAEQKTTLNTECIDLAEYYTKNTVDEKIAWLKEKGDSVCKDTLEKAVLKIHEAKGKVTNQKEKYSISWGKLKGIIKNHGYDAYISVVDATGDKEKIDSLRMVPKYDQGGFCFSTALIRSLAKEYAKDDSTEFEFSFANLTEDSKNTQLVVVIQVKGNAAAETKYYDYSTDPSIISNDNKPL